MIIAHLADLHLGYRAYHRVAPGGINMRERDVALAFRAAVDRVIELEPDLVLVAGDVFHSVRPPNAAIADAFRQFARLRRELPAAPVVVISGNHDSPRSVESGSILRLLAEIPGITVVEGGAKAVRLSDPDASIFCVPHAALAAGAGESLAWEPDPDASANLLMIHGTVTGGAAEGKLRFLGEYGGADIQAETLHPERWDYIALGHYHLATELAPNMWYAGALERTSSNIWEEADGEKGFITFDTDAGRATFHPVPTREVIDLPRIVARVRDVGPGDDAGRGKEGGTGDRADSEAKGQPTAGDAAPASGDGAAAPDEATRPLPVGRFMEPAELDAAIATAVDGIPGGLDGRIVRLVCMEVPRELFRELDHARIRAYKAEALHFQLDVRRPRVARTVGVGAPERRRTLEEELEAFLRNRYEPGRGDIERERLVRLALGYLGEVVDTGEGQGWALDGGSEAEAEAKAEARRGGAVGEAEAEAEAKAEAGDFSEGAA